MVPFCGCRMPRIFLIRVLLPEPLEPGNAQIIAFFYGKGNVADNFRSVITESQVINTNYFFGHCIPFFKFIKFFSIIEIKDSPFLMSVLAYVMSIIEFQ